MKNLPNILAIFLIQLSNGTEKGNANARAIGVGGKLLYSKDEVPGDMQRFMKYSKGGTVIVGPKTHAGFFTKTLKNRNIIVVSRHFSTTLKKVEEGLYHINDLYNAVAAAREFFPENEIIVAGGKPIYEKLIPYCDKLYVTEVYGDKEADTFINYSKGAFKEVERIENNHNGLEYDYVTFERINPINPEHGGDQS